MGFLSGGYSSSSTSGSTTGQTSGTTSRTLTPFQTQLQAPVYAQIMQQLQDPSAGVEPFRVAARNKVNANYTGLADSLRQQFFSTGGGGSGKYGQAVLQGDLARRGALSNVDQQAQESAAANQINWQQLAQGLLGMNFGSTSSGSSSGTSQGDTSGFGINGGVGYHV